MGSGPDVGPDPFSLVSTGRSPGYSWQNRDRWWGWTMGLRGGVSGIVAFLRAGYPSHAPAVGYAPLLALMPRRVCNDEVAMIAGALIGRQRRPIDNADVGVEITRVTDEMPSLEDFDRVARRLDAMGRAGG